MKITLTNYEIRTITEAIGKIVEETRWADKDTCCAQGKDEAYEMLKEIFGDPNDKSDSYAE